MGKRGFAGLALIISALLGASSSALATPLTYQFDLPDWATSATSSFGSNGILDVTVDDGSSSDVNQSYLNSQITQLSLTNVGGTFSDTWTSANVSADTVGAGFISTNSSGLATLDLLASATGAVYDVGNAIGTMQLGVIGAQGGSTTLIVHDTATGITGLYVPYLDGQFTGFEVTGNLVPGNGVPEPTSIALLVIGLAGIIVMRKRHQA